MKKYNVHSISNFRNNSFVKGVSKNKAYYFMLIPGLIVLGVMSYWPMYGVIIAFKDFQMAKGILGSPWCDPWYANFLDFFNSTYFTRLISNTLIISVAKIVTSKIGAVVLAIILNECRISWYKRVVQTVSYMPHFLSWVIVYGIVYIFCSESAGYINKILLYFDQPTVAMLTSNEYFRKLLVFSNMWKTIGYDSIIYLAAMSSIDTTLYEAASIDGAGRFGRIWHVTLPGIRSTFIMLCILSIGQIFSAGFEQIYAMYSPNVYETADIIDTWVYRAGLENMRFSLATAVGLFKNVIGFILVYSVNKLAKRWGENLW